MANHSKAENSADDKSYVGYLAPQTEQGKKYWNRFCWSCHLETPNEKRKCDACYHIYHMVCMGNDTICRDCKMANIRCKELNSGDREMLKDLHEKLMCDEQFMKSKAISRSLDVIKTKLDDYKNFATYLDDIGWTKQKCMVGYSVVENKLAPMAERLYMECVYQVDSMLDAMNASKSVDQKSVSPIKIETVTTLPSTSSGTKIMSPLIRLRPVQQLQTGSTNRSNVVNGQQNETSTSINGIHAINESKPFIPPTRKRKEADDASTLATTAPSAKKSTAAPMQSDHEINYLKMNFKDYVDKSKKICDGVENLENTVRELQLAKNRMVSEATQRQQDMDKLMSENHSLRQEIGKINASWMQKLILAQRQQWCIVCHKKPDMPFLCSNTCRMKYWKRQIESNE